MHTKFSGSNGQNAHRWLRTLRYENPQITNVSPSDWLGIIDGLLEGDAAIWADHHPRAKHILRAGSLKEATRVDVETFKKALIARFPPVELTISRSRPPLVLSSPILEQAPHEDLDSYYQRTLLLLYQRNGVDLAEAPLTEQEHNALKKTVTSHIAGLTDDEIRREVEKVWIDSKASLSLSEINKLSKGKKLVKWLGEEQKRMETRLPGQAARDQTPNRANFPGTSSDSAVFTGNMGNVGPFSNLRANSDNLSKPNNEKLAPGLDDIRSFFDGLGKDRPNVNNEMHTAGAGATSSLFSNPESAEKAPISQYRSLPALLPRKPTNTTASTSDQVQNWSPETRFTGRVGNPHHTPNTSNSSNPPTTLPNESMFGGATGSPSRSRSSLFEGSPAYSIFDARHPANKDKTVPPAYKEIAKFFGNGTVTGANRGNPPQHYLGIPRPDPFPFDPLLDPLTKKPTSGLFGGETAPSRAAKGASPNRHTRRPSNLEVETHLPPSRLSEDTVRQFYSPGRNVFGNFSTQSPSGVPDAANPSNTTTNASATTSHQTPSIQIDTPSMFDNPYINSTLPEDRPPRDSNTHTHSQVSLDAFMRQLAQPNTYPPHLDTEPAHGTKIQTRDHHTNHSPFPSPTPKIPTSPITTTTTTSTLHEVNSPSRSYSQTLTTPTHLTAASNTDPETESEPEIPIMIKQSQGRRKRRGRI